MQQISKAAIRRLRLKRGDVLLVRGHPDEMLELAKTGVKGVPQVPIIWLPRQTSLHRMSREYLLKLLARTENAAANSATDAIPSSDCRASHD